MSGASGARAWLQAHPLTWLTPARMRAATIALFAVALVVSSIGLGGSGGGVHHAAMQTASIAHHQ